MTGPRRRPRPRLEDRQRGWRLYGQLRRERFWCETCGGTHPLAEHNRCRQTRRGSRP